MKPSRRFAGLPNQLTKVGKDAFAKLCRLGCDGAKLEGLFGWLAEQSKIDINGLKNVRNQPLDSWEQAFGGLTRNEVQVQIPRMAKKLQSYVLRLRETPAIDYLNATGRTEDSDLLYAYASPRHSRSHPAFRALLSLPQIAYQMGSRKRPDFTRYLARLCRYVKDHTRMWHDAEIAAMLSDLFPTRSHLPQDQETLKKWRRKHGVIEPCKPSATAARQ